MKILFLTTYFPFPICTGFQRVSSKLLKTLAEDHEIYLASLYPSYQVGIDLAMAEKYCKKIIALENPRKGPLSIFQKLDLVRFLLFSFLPYQAWAHHSSEIARQLSRWKKEPFDLVVCEAIWMLRYRYLFPDVPVILHEHCWDSEALLYRSQKEVYLLQRLLLEHLQRRMERFEKSHLPTLRYCISNSKEILQGLQSLCPSLPSQVIPIVVDVTDHRVSRFGGGDPDMILFVGDFSYYPNVDAALFFCNEIFPRILSRCPTAKLLLVGANSPPPILQLQSPSVRVLGFVEDIRPIYSKARVLVAPIRIGGGIRVKVVEAMSQGIPVVSTSIAASGLEVIPGKEIMMCDDPADFGEAVVTLLGNAPLAMEMGEKARSFIESHFSDTLIRSRLQQVLEAVFLKAIQPAPV